MNFLYNISIHLYKFLVFIAAGFNHKAKLMIQGRKNWANILSEKIEKDAKYIWLHAASLGEFEQGRPLIEKIKQQHPQYKIIVTFFSPSGYEIRKNYPLADIIMYLPFDTPRNAKRFLKIVQPHMAIYVKYEFWKNLLKGLHQMNIPTYLISGVFRHDQVFFKPYGKGYQKVLSYFTYIFLQNQASYELGKTIHIKNMQVAGDTRYDRVNQTALDAKDNEYVQKFTQNSFTVIGGSTWPPEEEILANIAQKYQGKLKLIIAPHEVDEDNILRITKLFNEKTIRYTHIKSNTMLNNYDVMIIDTIGLLSTIYKYGTVSFVGGGFGTKGLHNILEPATFGMPVIFGPNHKKFHEASELIAIKGGFDAKDQNEAIAIFDSLFSSPDYLEKTGKHAREMIAKSVGATKLILDHFRL